jgi:protein TonB
LQRWIGRFLPEHTLSAISAQAAWPAPPVTRLPLVSDVLPVTMAVSIVFHAFLLLITFSPPEFAADKFTPQLDVVLVNAKSPGKPGQADMLAQASLDGGGNVELDRRAKSNLPVVHDMQLGDPVQLAARRVEQLEQEAQRLLRLAGDSAATDSVNRLAPQSEAREQLEDAALESRRLLIARLEAEIARDWEAYQKLPRRKFIGARTEGVVYAEYVDNWRQKIEKVGTANFPEEAKRKRLYGSLLLTVSINADGTVEKVEIERSSGHRVLDTAALRIVDLAGPFAPFPQAVRAQYDVLSITRSWSFTRSDLEITTAQ